jgi:hypothetical protein
MYAFGEYPVEAMRLGTPDYVAISHGGHGVNSYFLSYQLILGPLGLFTQIAFGGAYADPQAEIADMRDRFEAIAALIGVTERVMPMWDGRRRLLVLDSPGRGTQACAWVDLDDDLTDPHLHAWADHAVTADALGEAMSQLRRAQEVQMAGSAPTVTPLTLRQAATALGLSEVWVRRLVKMGRIEAGHGPRGLVIERAAVEAYRRRVTGSPAGQSGTLRIDDWDWEGNVVVALVKHLEDLGWRVLERADPAIREHGVDLVVERDGVRRAIEVKGYPSASYRTGSKAGEPKPWRAPQARSYMGGLLLEAMLLPEKKPGHEVAIAVPDRETFTTLIERLTVPLGRLGIGVYVVHEGGRIEERLQAAAAG